MSAKGGITKGKSHKEGGIPMKVKNTGQNIEVEGGEGIINKTNMADTELHEFEGKKMTKCEIASEINSDGGNGVEIDCDGITGKKYKHEDGGRIYAEGGGENPIDWNAIKKPQVKYNESNPEQYYVTYYLDEQYSDGTQMRSHVRTKYFDDYDKTIKFAKKKILGEIKYFDNGWESLIQYYDGKFIYAEGGKLKERTNRKGDIGNRDKKTKVDTIKGDRYFRVIDYDKNGDFLKEKKMSIEGGMGLIEHLIGEDYPYVNHSRNDGMEYDFYWGDPEDEDNLGKRYASIFETSFWYKKGGGVKDKHTLNIDGYNWFLEKIDNTHFYMSNDRDFRGTAHHIGQHRGQLYYDEVRQWLKDTYAGGGKVAYSEILNEVLDERGYESEEDINKDKMSRHEASEIRKEAQERYINHPNYIAEYKDLGMLKYAGGGKMSDSDFDALIEKIRFQKKLYFKELAELRSGKRKTINLYFVQEKEVNGWKDLTAENTMEEATYEKEIYENDGGRFELRVVKKSVKKADFEDWLEKDNYAKGGQTEGGIGMGVLESGGLFGVFPDLTKNERDKIAEVYIGDKTNLQTLKKKHGGDILSMDECASCMDEYNQTKQAKNTIKSFANGGMLSHPANKDVQVLFKRNVDATIVDESGNFKFAKIYKKGEMENLVFLFKENNNVFFKFPLVRGYMKVDKDDIKIEGFDYEFGGGINPFEETTLSQNDIDILDLLRRTHTTQLTILQQQFISTFIGTNVVNSMSNSLIKKIFGLVYENKSMEVSLKTFTIINNGKGNVLSLAPIDLDKILVTDEDFTRSRDLVLEDYLIKYSSMERKINRLINKSKDVNWEYDSVMRDKHYQSDAILLFHGGINPFDTYLKNYLYPSKLPIQIGLGVAEFDSPLKMKSFYENLKRYDSRFTYKAIEINQGITANGVNTLIYIIKKGY